MSILRRLLLLLLIPGFSSGLIQAAPAEVGGSGFQYQVATHDEGAITYDSAWQLFAPDRSYILFEAKGTEELGLALSDVQVPEQSKYFLFLGGWEDGTWTSLERNNRWVGQGGEAASYLGQVLYPGQFTPYWIGFKDGTLTLGFGTEPGENILKSWPADERRPTKNIKYFTFAGYGADVEVQNISVQEIPEAVPPTVGGETFEYTADDRVHEYEALTYSDNWQLPVSGKGYISFEAKGTAELGVSLSNSRESYQSRLLLFLGGWGGDWTSLEQDDQWVGDAEEEASYIGQVLSPDEYRPYWVSYDYENAEFAFGAGSDPNYNILKTWTLESPPEDILYFSLVGYSNDLSVRKIKANKLMRLPEVGGTGFVYDKNIHQYGVVTYNDAWQFPLDKGYITFEARGSVELGVTMSDSIESNQHKYRILINGWGGSRTVLDQRGGWVGGGEPAANYAGNVLDPSQFRQFWIAVSDGTIIFGSGAEPGENILKSWPDDVPATGIRFFSFAGYADNVEVRNITIGDYGPIAEELRKAQGAERFKNEVITTIDGTVNKPIDEQIKVIESVLVTCETQERVLPAIGTKVIEKLRELVEQEPQTSQSLKKIKELIEKTVGSKATNEVQKPTLTQEVVPTVTEKIAKKEAAEEEARKAQEAERFKNEVITTIDGTVNKPIDEQIKVIESVLVTCETQERVLPAIGTKVIEKLRELVEQEPQTSQSLKKIKELIEKTVGGKATNEVQKPTLTQEIAPTVTEKIAKKEAEEEAERLRLEEEARRKAEEKERRKAEEEARIKASEEAGKAFVSWITNSIASIAGQTFQQQVETMIWITTSSAGQPTIPDDAKNLYFKKIQELCNQVLEEVGQITKCRELLELAKTSNLLTEEQKKIIIDELIPKLDQKIAPYRKETLSEKSPQEPQIKRKPEERQKEPLPKKTLTEESVVKPVTPVEPVEVKSTETKPVEAKTVTSTEKVETKPLTLEQKREKKKEEDEEKLQSVSEEILKKALEVLKKAEEELAKQKAIVAAAPTPEEKFVAEEKVAEAVKQVTIAEIGVGEAVFNKEAFEKLASLPKEFLRELAYADKIAVGSRNGELEVWMIDRDGRLFRYDTYSPDADPWIRNFAKGGEGKPMILKDLSVSSDGILMVINKDGKIYQYDWDTQSFVPLEPGVDFIQAAFDMISVGNQETIWAIDSNKNALQYNTEKKTWEMRRKGTLTYINVGFDETVLALNEEDEPYEYKGDNKWFELPYETPLKRLAVGSSKEVVWAVDAETKLWKLEGEVWKPILDADGKQSQGIKEVAINAADSIFLATAGGNTWNNKEDAVEIVKKPGKKPEVKKKKPQKKSRRKRKGRRRGKAKKRKKTNKKRKMRLSVKDLRKVKALKAKKKAKKKKGKQKATKKKAKKKRKAGKKKKRKKKSGKKKKKRKKKPKIDKVPIAMPAAQSVK